MRGLHDRKRNYGSEPFVDLVGPFNTCFVEGSILCMLGIRTNEMVAWPGVTRASSLIFPNTEREVKPMHRDLCLIGGRMYGLSLSTVRLRKMMAMICISERKRCVVYWDRRGREKGRQNKPKHMSASSPEVITCPDPNRGPVTKLQDFCKCIVRREIQEKGKVCTINVVIRLVLSLHSTRTQCSSVVWLVVIDPLQEKLLPCVDPHIK